MGKVNIWLKRSFITVASLMTIIGALMLAGTLFSHGHYHRDDEIEDMIVGINAMYALSITILVLPIIGLFGACKEKRWVLIVFTVGMILCSLFVLYMAIHMLIIRPMLIKILSKFYLSMQPISNASEVDLKVLQETQIELECCGVQEGYTEWGYNISESCLCNNSLANCIAAPRNSSLFQLTDNTPVMIFKEPCFPIILSHFNLGVNLLVGISMGLTSLWTLSCALSIAILCQLKEKKDTVVVAYSREAKTGNYAVLAEPAELT
ncbi:tetraspanin-8-like [Corythoichthys intestinalis]|uniref:tetraspanin-8-like n=1 Tax=Corythoichthys intestinalis TaxID=161448 RepID=UPI0025A669D2|nr:tetraspanin-8-like [Corythoichthys intestinalis]XP_061809499.1 tetraspanin-8-like [Nerophis lumbriciformis]